MSTNPPSRRWSRYRPGAAGDESESSSPARSGPTQSGPTQSRPEAPGYRSAGVKGGRSTTMHPAGKVILALIGVLVVGIVGFVVWIIATETGIVGDSAEDQPRTDEGYAEFVAAIEEQNGGTEVYEVSVYESFAYAEVPVPGGDRRSITYQWMNGDLAEWTKASGLDEPLFDMADLDPSAFRSACAAARDLVEEPGDCSVFVRAPEEGDGWISAHVGNDFGEYGNVTADLDGEVLETRAPGE